MALLGAWLMWLPIDIFIAGGIVMFVRADRRYQAAKLARLQAEGLYRPFIDWTEGPGLARVEAQLEQPDE